MMSKRSVPMFDLVGPPCKTEGCEGVLVSTISLKTEEAFDKCSKCGGEFHKMPVSEKLSWAKRVIGRVLRGEKVD